MDNTASKDQFILQIVDQLSALCCRVDEKIDKEQQQLEACKKKTELECKMAQELKLNKELLSRMLEVSQRGSVLDRVCADLESRLIIANSDQNRLDHAREMYQLAKELTGIRLDFSAPPNLAKGYVKSESRKVLEAFEVEAPGVEELWHRLAHAHLDKENYPYNM